MSENDRKAGEINKAALIYKMRKSKGEPLFHDSKWRKGCRCEDRGVCGLITVKKNDGGVEIYMINRVRRDWINFYFSYFEKQWYFNEGGLKPAPIEKVRKFLKGVQKRCYKFEVTKEEERESDFVSCAELKRGQKR